MTTATLSEFAALEGVKPSYVTKLKKHDRLVFTADGKVDVEASRKRIAATADPNRDDVRARHAAAREQNGGTESTATPETPVTPASAQADHGRDAVSTNFQKARALGEHFSAKTRALEFLKEVGEMVELAQIREEVENVLSVTRAAFDNLPGQLAPQLVTMTDEQAIDRLLQDNIDAVLGELSKKLRDMTKLAF